jgi:hypothetical protein
MGCSQKGCSETKRYCEQFKNTKPKRWIIFELETISLENANPVRKTAFYSVCFYFKQLKPLLKSKNISFTNHANNWDGKKIQNEARCSRFNTECWIMSLCRPQTESDEGVAWNHLNNFVSVIQKFQSILKQV